jgi:hypothetical protein
MRRERFECFGVQRSSNRLDEAFSPARRLAWQCLRNLADRQRPVELGEQGDGDDPRIAISVVATSALLRQVDIGVAAADVRFMPTGDISEMKEARQLRRPIKKPA